MGEIDISAKAISLKMMFLQTFLTLNYFMEGR